MAKHPSCGELSIEEFSNVDWDKINLDEWVALMQEAGMFGADADKIALEGLTGKGSALDTTVCVKMPQNARRRALRASIWKCDARILGFDFGWQRQRKHPLSRRSRRKNATYFLRFLIRKSFCRRKKSLNRVQSLAER